MNPHSPVTAIKNDVTSVSGIPPVNMYNQIIIPVNISTSMNSIRRIRFIVFSVSFFINITHNGHASATTESLIPYTALIAPTLWPFEVPPTVMPASLIVMSLQ